MKILHLIIIGLFFSIISKAQPSTKDSSHCRDVKALVIVYDITYPNKKKPSEVTAKFYKAITMIYKNKFTNTYYAENGYATVQMSDDSGETIYTYLPAPKHIVKTYRNDGPGFGINQTTSDMHKSKNILNLDCNVIQLQSTFNVNDMSFTQTSYMYMYDKFEKYKLNYTGVKGVKGVLIGQDVDYTRKIIQSWTAQSITEQMVDSTYFMVPSDYNILSTNEYIQKLTNDKAFRKQIKSQYKLDASSKWQTIFDVFAQKAPELINQTSQNNISLQAQNGSTTATSNCDSYMREYQNQKNLCNSAYQSYTTTKITSSNVALRGSLLKSVKATQKLMKSIRERAAKNGCTIPIAGEESY